MSGMSASLSPWHRSLTPIDVPCEAVYQPGALWVLGVLKGLTKGMEAWLSGVALA